MMSKASRNSGVGLSGAVVAALLALILLYLGPFVILVLDEWMFGSWLFQHTPDWLHEWARIIYWPIIKLIEFLAAI